MPSPSVNFIPRSPRAPKQEPMRAGAVLRSSNEAFSALQSGAKAKADFERKFFGVDSDTWLEDFKREYAELSDKRYHYSAQHK